MLELMYTTCEVFLVHRWIHNSYFDLSFIIGPAFLSILAGLFLNYHSSFLVNSAALIVTICFFVEGTHRFSTLFRTYLSPSDFVRNKFVWIWAPVICWLIGSGLYFMKDIYFWRILATWAVFHFIRQQYGFFMIYLKKQPLHSRFLWLDKLMIYSTMVYPLIYWLSVASSDFGWFVPGDLVVIKNPVYERFSFYAYVIVGFLYVLKENYIWLRYKEFNLPKNLLLLGTALSWWVGGRVFKNKLIFVVINTLSHPIPYLALVWLYGSKESKTEKDGKLLFNVPTRLIYSLKFFPIFILFLLGLTYFVAGVWDGFVLHRFAIFTWLPPVSGHLALSMLIPFLALPQAIHYLADGYIWRIKKTDPWKNYILPDEHL